MKGTYTVEHNGKEFNRNPQNLNPNIVFMGRISHGKLPEDYIDVYGITPEEVIALGKEFKQIEPKTNMIFIWGPVHFLGIDKDDRTYVTTVYL